jgi:hypothetical protein
VPLEIEIHNLGDFTLKDLIITVVLAGRPTILYKIQDDDARVPSLPSEPRPFGAPRVVEGVQGYLHVASHRNAILSNMAATTWPAGALVFSELQIGREGLECPNP